MIKMLIDIVLLSLESLDSMKTSNKMQDKKKHLNFFLFLKGHSLHVYLYSSGYVAPEIRLRPIFKARGSEENNVTSFEYRLKPEKKTFSKLRRARKDDTFNGWGWIQLTFIWPQLVLQE